MKSHEISISPRLPGHRMAATSVEDGRDSADSAVALGDLGGVSRRPPETRVASAVATALRQVSPGT